MRWNVQYELVGPACLALAIAFSLGLMIGVSFLETALPAQIDGGITEAGSTNGVIKGPEATVALWTAIMGASAVIGLGLSAAGIGLIWRQVTLTRKAVSETSEATKAMLQANTIAQGVGFAQTRAYVTVTSATLRIDEALGCISISWELFNSGNSPALDCELVAQIVFFTDSGTQTNYVSMSAGPIPIGAHKVGPYSFADEKIDETAAKATTALHLYNAVFIRDVFEQEASSFTAYTVVGGPSFIFGQEHLASLPLMLVERFLSKLKDRRMKIRDLKIAGMGTAD